MSRGLWTLIAVVIPVNGDKGEPVGVATAADTAEDAMAKARRFIASSLPGCDIGSMSPPEPRGDDLAIIAGADCIFTDVQVHDADAAESFLRRQAELRDARAADDEASLRGEFSVAEAETRWRHREDDRPLLPRVLIRAVKLVVPIVMTISTPIVFLLGGLLALFLPLAALALLGGLISVAWNSLGPIAGGVPAILLVVGLFVGLPSRDVPFTVDLIRWLFVAPWRLLRRLRRQHPSTAPTPQVADERLSGVD